MNFLIYNVPGEEASVSVIVKNETIWLTQKAMAELFGVGVPAISKHLKNIFEEGELMEEGGVSKCAPSFFMHKAPTFTSRGFVIT